MVVRDVLAEHGLRGYPKTSGSKGIHVNVRIEPRWDFLEVRRAALALAREVERRAPDLATSKWWKEERHGVFVDYNQNARDRTVASCYSVRPTPDARVSCALRWDEVPDVEPGDLRLDTVPERVRAIGDPGADIDEHAGSLDAAARPRAPRRGGGPRRRALAAALPEAAGEPKRVQPSRDRDRPTQRGRAGDPQPGGPPPGVAPAGSSAASARSRTKKKNHKKEKENKNRGGEEEERGAKQQEQEPEQREIPGEGEREGGGGGEGRRTRMRDPGRRGDDRLPVRHPLESTQTPM